eukprot:TRINITY_DN2073_c0_g1_i1.p1 TRINITY_DN2073_c0_g1~~TRINITY_DN2073_c0_g1_i1.p1  ORF type:complete len:460 (+),score=91.68 TRINITY_DN2073_c0_g1_i1:59-1438(+)
MKVVRDSKFRHVHGEALKETFQDLRLSTKSSESSGIRGNSKFFAFPWESGGGGTLAVIPLTQHGRLGSRGVPLITGHTGGILDFEFNPFDDNMIVTASEDLTLKVWQVPEGGLKEHMKDPVATLEGHGKKVSFSSYNPTASNIVASSSFDLTCKIWNVEEEREAFSIALPDVAFSQKWNYMGSLLAITCKDKKMKIVDPRQSKIASETKIHEGAKASKVEWMGSVSASEECYKLVTTGFSAQAERQMFYWDIRTFGDARAPALHEVTLDQGTGSLFPIFDHGTQMLYVAGKGDANVRYFEVTPEAPYFHFISNFTSTTPQKAFDFLPKRCVDVSKHEIMRGLKLESNAMIPVTFRVPRKSEAFQDDIYPDCPAGVPSIGCEEWVDSEEARLPILRSMKPGSEASSAAAPKAAAPVVTAKELKKLLAEAEARIKTLEAENASLRAQLGEKAGGSQGYGQS